MLILLRPETGTRYREVIANMGITWKQIDERRKIGKRHLLCVEILNVFDSVGNKTGDLDVSSFIDMSNLVVKTTESDTHFPIKYVSWEDPEKNEEVSRETILKRLKNQKPLNVKITGGAFKSCKGKLNYNLKYFDELFIYDHYVMISINICYHREYTQLSWVHKKIR